MGQFLGDKQLEVLHTKVYYKSLDIGYGGCEDYDFYTKAQAILSREKDLRDVSNKILKALCYVYKKSSRQHFDTNICNFLYYWLGNVLLSKLKLKDLYSEIIIKLFLTLKDKNSLVVCENPYPYMDKDDFEKIKLIFDCSEDYKGYNEQHHNVIKSCNKNYKTHLDKNIETYNNFYRECVVEKINNKNDRCKAFKEYFPYNESNLLSKFKCNFNPEETYPEQPTESYDDESEQPPAQQRVERVTDQAQLDKTRREVALQAETTRSSIYPFNTDISDVYGIPEVSDGTPSTITSKIYSRRKLDKQIIRKNNKDES
ncbi:VIR protein [Plasmodium vivax]|uniref:VIR protein n=1 Tax=Plasmodium vivax TaxID=5855 RepID=A0A1G4EFT1_PLAVI|nr:VIR protein [Plasmodium vivax]